VELGIGRIKNVFNALITGLLIALESVYLFLINAKLSTLPDHVLHAMPDTISIMVNVLLPPSKKLLMLDAPLGIGKIKNAFNALLTGLPTMPVSVFQFLINAANGILTDFVLSATLVTIW